MAGTHYRENYFVFVRIANNRHALVIYPGSWERHLVLFACPALSFNTCISFNYWPDLLLCLPLFFSFPHPPYHQSPWPAVMYVSATYFISLTSFPSRECYCYFADLFTLTIDCQGNYVLLLTISSSFLP